MTGIKEFNYLFKAQVLEQKFAIVVISLNFRYRIETIESALSSLTIAPVWDQDANLVWVTLRSQYSANSILAELAETAVLLDAKEEKGDDD